MGEFLLIMVVAIAVIPARDWPTVARAMARTVKFIRDLIWKISDSADKIREQIDMEKPIDELSKKTMDDVMDVFSSALPEKSKRKPTKSKIMVSSRGSPRARARDLVKTGK